MNFKNLSHSVSVKTKTVILVWILIIMLSTVFFFIRYFDIKNFASNNQLLELKRVTVVYKETLKRIRKFYTTRGYANINSYGIVKAFVKKDVKSLHDLSLPRWKIIAKENRYLTSFSFYDKNGKLLTYFRQKPQSHLSYFDSLKKPYDGFWYDNGEFLYHTVSEARDKNSNIVGFVVFAINPKYFLAQIRKIMDIDAHIYFDDSKHKMLFSLEKDKQIDNYIKKNNFFNLKETRIGGRDFLSYIINGKGIDKNNDFKIVFLQDISHWEEIVDKAILQSIIVMFLLTIVTVVVINYGFDVILRQLDELNQKLVKSQNELKELNKNLQLRVQKEIGLKLKKQREANEKERILVHQSKLASMGEMIGNIAHQWRQPLTELSSILINMELFFERGKLTKQKLESKIEDANTQISFMSKTIDDFRNFFSSGKQKETLNVSIPIKKVQKLMSVSLKNNGIKLNIEIQDDFHIFAYPNEMTQALLNLVNNAKDALIERRVKDAFIHIVTYDEDNKHIIKVEDNAGGIYIEPLDKVFEPYFSTKHATIGTGIGLYMTKIIVEKNNSGIILVDNYSKGAVFTIIFDS
ncbi:MAG: ATP-binding protein [Sulfurospirillum sp.]